MITIDKFSELVSSTYRAALDGAAWQGVLTKLVGAVGATTGALIVSRPRSRSLGAVSVGADPTAVAHYHEYYGRLDPIAAALEHAEVGTVLTPSMVVERGQRSRQEFFVDWAFPHGVGDGIFASISRDATMSCSLILAAPDRNAELATPERLRLVRLLVPHLAQAVRMQAVFEATGIERDSALDALDRAAYGVVVLSPDGKPRFANRAALALSARHDGLALDRHGVRASARAAQVELQALIARVGRGGGAGIVRVPRPSGRRAFVVLALPLTRPHRAQLGALPPSVLVAIADPDCQARLPADVLEELFDLTAAEAAVAIEILGCDGLQAIADRLGVTLSTIRVHLQRVFEKTGVHRQAELVRLLLELLPAVAMI